MAGAGHGDRFREGDRLALRVKETAVALGVSERTLRQHLPEIPHLRLGSAVVVPVDALREWLRQQAQVEPAKIDRAVDEVLASLNED